MLLHLHHQCFSSEVMGLLPVQLGSYFVIQGRRVFMRVPTGPVLWNALGPVSVVDVMVCSTLMCLISLIPLQIILGVTTGLSGVAQSQSRLLDVNRETCHVTAIICTCGAPRMLILPCVRCSTNKTNYFHPKELCQLGSNPSSEGLLSSAEVAVGIHVS